MKKTIDEKTGKKTVVFNTYEKVSGQCPECKRILKERDIKLLEQQNQITCIKCGAKLKK